jgi:hypothetical protein
MRVIEGSGDRRRLSELVESLATRARPVRIVRKGAAWHQRAAAIALKVLTFGGQRTFMTHYVTTLGHTIYVPDDFDGWDPGTSWEILRHELVHVAQFERYGWLGMIAIYGFFPLPALLSYGRARLEWEAYTETLRAVRDRRGLAAARDPALHAMLKRRFTGPDYGWMWPFPEAIQRWIDHAIRAMEAEET